MLKIIPKPEFVSFFNRNGFAPQSSVLLKKPQIDRLSDAIQEKYGLCFLLFFDIFVKEISYDNHEVSINFNNWEEAYDCYISFATGFENKKC